jgi:hypothetical protein
MDLTPHLRSLWDVIEMYTKPMKIFNEGNLGICESESKMRENP